MHPDKLSRGWNPHEGNNAACLRLGICENKLARAACQEESPAVLRYSQKCPESLDGFLSQATKFLINPFTRRCTLTNYQGGGTPYEGNNAVCLRVGICEKNWPGQPAKKKAPLFSGTARNVQNLWMASCPKPPNSLSIPLLEDAP